jgi:hypothetical protein
MDRFWRFFKYPSRPKFLMRGAEDGDHGDEDRKPRRESAIQGVPNLPAQGERTLAAVVLHKLPPDELASTCDKEREVEKIKKVVKK